MADNSTAQREVVEQLADSFVARFRQGERLVLGLADGGVVIWDIAEMSSELDEFGVGWTTSGGINLKKPLLPYRD